MSIFSKDIDEEYQDYLNSDGSMLGKKDFEEFKRIKDRAFEIHSGFASGTFENDEDVWAEVRKLEDK